MSFLNFYPGPLNSVHRLSISTNVDIYIRKCGYLHPQMGISTYRNGGHPHPQMGIWTRSLKRTTKFRPAKMGKTYFHHYVRVSGTSAFFLKYSSYALLSYLRYKASGRENCYTKHTAIISFSTASNPKFAGYTP